jgi:hypothetical protein
MSEVIKLSLLRRFGVKRTPEEMAAHQAKLAEVRATKRAERLPKPRKKKEPKEPYAHVTARWQIAADRVDAAQVGVALRYIQSMEQARGNYGAFPVPNSRMEEWGVDKWRKMRALRRLAAAGLVLLDATDHHNPKVTILESS